MYIKDLFEKLDCLIKQYARKDTESSGSQQLNLKSIFITVGERTTGCWLIQQLPYQSDPSYNKTPIYKSSWLIINWSILKTQLKIYK